MARKLLIVDDINATRQILSRGLAKDYTILEASNGHEAKEILQSNPRSISAVLLDIIMPEMDGYELLQYIKSTPTLCLIPVIIVTGTDESDARLKALSLGANDFIMKPYSIELIRHCLRNNIKQRETASMINAIQKDKLTGIYNRDAFLSNASKMIKYHEPGFYVMSCFDIDNFKLVNNQFGSLEGDRILRHIGSSLEEALAAQHGICGRITGDVFAVLYPNSLDILEKMTQLMSGDIVPNDTLANLTFSVGRYIVSDRMLPVSAMYDRAYLAKQSVKGRYDEHIAYFDDAMLEKLVRDQEIINDMGNALSRFQFETWFQPQYNHSTGALIGAEALVRWRHPKRGLLIPNTFIPVFEQNGFIYELDKHVIESVCRHLRRWMDQGRNPLPVSVNLSRYDIFKPDLVDFITGITEKYELPVNLLRLEITESAFCSSAEQMIAVVKRLIALGYTIEIDDFGSGYSSLNTLKDVPAQVLKLDMRFLENGENSERGGNVLESIVRMAKWLNMSVIAEGVETVAQANFLKSIGCSYVQGYLYARPMPVEDYEELAKHSGKEEHLLALDAVENLDSNSFWDPRSMETLIFNSFIGGACIYEYYNGEIELLRANDKYSQIFGDEGMPIENALKLSWNEHMDEASRVRLVSDLHISIETRDEVVGEYLFLELPDCPRETWIRSTMRVIASAGERYLVYSTNENITEHRALEQREQETAEKLQMIMDNIGSGITAVILREPKNEFLFANEKYYQLLGCTEAQYALLTADDPFAAVHPDDREQVRGLVKNASSTQTGLTLEYRIVKPNGEVAWLSTEITIANFLEADNSVLLASYSDITAEKESSKQLELLIDMTNELLAQPNSSEGIKVTLSKLLSCFGGMRAYIYKFDTKTNSTAITYEACADGVANSSGGQGVPFESAEVWLDVFEHKSYVSIPDVEALDESCTKEKALLQAKDIRSFIAVPLMQNDALLGFVGIENPQKQLTQTARLVTLGSYITMLLTRRGAGIPTDS